MDDNPFRPRLVLIESELLEIEVDSALLDGLISIAGVVGDTSVVLLCNFK